MQNQCHIVDLKEFIKYESVLEVINGKVKTGIQNGIKLAAINFRGLFSNQLSLIHPIHTT